MGNKLAARDAFAQVVAENPENDQAAAALAKLDGELSMKYSSHVQPEIMFPLALTC